MGRQTKIPDVIRLGTLKNEEKKMKCVLMLAALMFIGGCVHCPHENLADVQEEQLLNERLPGDPIPATLKIVEIRF